MPTMDGRLPVEAAGSLISFSHTVKSLGGTVSFIAQSGTSIVHVARNLLLAKVMSDPSITGVLHIDSDIVFSPDDAVKLVAASGLYDMTVGLYRAKTDSAMYIVTPESGASIDQYKTLKLSRAPMGFAYVKRKALDVLWANHADKQSKHGDSVTRVVFDVEYKDGDLVGEDFCFCDKFRAAGFTIGAVTDISLGHIGQKEYRGDFLSFCEGLV